MKKRKKKKQKISFGVIYFSIAAVLTVFLVFALFYVRGLLISYENSQPEKLVRDLIDELKTDALQDNIWKKYEFPTVEYSEFEEGMDLAEIYKEDFASGELKYSLKQGEHVGGDTMTYNIFGSGNTVIAEVKLKAVGEPKTRLAVFTLQDWQIMSFKITAEKADYSIEAPISFTVNVNGVVLGNDHVAEVNNGKTNYEISGLFLMPELEITDENGNIAEYKKSGKTIKTVYYDYSLTLPSALTVKLNGEVCTGTMLDDGTTHYDIRMLTEPKVTISDMFGYELTYEGGITIPLTYFTLKVPDTFTVEIERDTVLQVPSERIKIYDNPEYDNFKDYVDGLPRIAEYSIAVLDDNVRVKVTDSNGAEVSYDPSERIVDLTDMGGTEDIPEALRADILEIAEKWSLLMSDDIGGYAHGFYTLTEDLIENSYIYTVAYKWVNSVDITFTNTHSLGNPPFIDESVTNLRYITDKCLAVDVSFGKQMILANGPIIDRMNATLYFVWYDGTNDYTDNPSWKLVRIKEIVE